MDSSYRFRFVEELLAAKYPQEVARAYRVIQPGERSDYREDHGHTATPSSTDPVPISICGAGLPGAWRKVGRQDYGNSLRMMPPLAGELKSGLGPGRRR